MALASVERDEASRDSQSSDDTDTTREAPENKPARSGS